MEAVTLPLKLLSSPELAMDTEQEPEQDRLDGGGEGAELDGGGEGLNSEVAAQSWVLAVRRAMECGVQRVSGAMVAKAVADTTVVGLSRTDDSDACSKEMSAASNARTTATRAGPVAPPTGQAVFMRSESNEWYTPENILTLVRQLFAPGSIDLDPCSSCDANERMGVQVL